jgi:hypothetical protein
MNRHAEPPRYEIKIPCAPHYLPQIRAWVRLHPAQWRVTYPPRQVNNVYFDTADAACLNGNLSGVGGRRKLRLRWYGPTLDTVTGGRLELKCRDGAIGWKEVSPLDATLALKGKRWHEIVRVLRGAADKVAGLWLAHLSIPVLINHYSRAYYATPDESVRLTLDTDLRAYSQRLSACPNLTRPVPLDERVVVELKAAPDDVSFRQLAAALARFPARPGRHSKYVQGMLAGADLDGVFLP